MSEVSELSLGWETSTHELTINLVQTDAQGSIILSSITIPKSAIHPPRKTKKQNYQHNDGTDGYFPY